MTFLFTYALCSFVTLVVILNYNQNVWPRMTAQAVLNGDPEPKYISDKELMVCLLLSPFFLAGILALAIVRALGRLS